MRSEENFKNPTRVNILRLKREDVASMKQEYNTMGKMDQIIRIHTF